MATKRMPDWLPTGWKVLDKVKNGRKIRCYINLDTGTRVYSKPAVMRHAKSEGTSSGIALQKRPHVRRSTRNIQVEPVRETIHIHAREANHNASREANHPPVKDVDHTPVKDAHHSLVKDANHTPVKDANHTPVKDANRTPVKHAHHTPVKDANHTSVKDENHTPVKDENHTPVKDANHTPVMDANHKPHWLPHDWIMELRFRKSGAKEGNTYKRYLDPSTGKSFYSKVAVMRYLKEMQFMSGSSEQKMSSSAANTSTSDHPSKSLRSSGRKKPLHQKSLEQKTESSKSCAHALKSKKSNVIQKEPQNTKSVEQNTDPSKSSDHLPKGWKSAERKKLLHQKSLKHKTGSSKSSACALESMKSDAEEKEPLNEKSDQIQIDPSKSLVCALRSEKSDVEEKQPRNKKSDEIQTVPSKSSICASKSQKSDVEQKEPQKEKSDEQKSDLSKNSVWALKSQESDAEQKDPQNKISDPQKSDTLKSSGCASKSLVFDAEQKELQNEESDEQVDLSKVRIEKVLDEKLPPGWMREIRIYNLPDKVKRDSFYIDPVSGYVFRSRLDVVRYLDTGEISCHAFKRKNCDLSDLNLPTEENTSLHSAKRSKAAKSRNSIQLFEGERNPEGGSSSELIREGHYGGLSTQGSGLNSPQVVLKNVHRQGEKNALNKESSNLSGQLLVDARGRNGNYAEHMNVDECAALKEIPDVEVEPPAGGSLKEVHTPINSSDKPSLARDSPTRERNSLQMQTSEIIVQGSSRRRKNRKVASERKPFSVPSGEMFVKRELGSLDKKGTVKHRADEDEEWNSNSRKRNPRKRNKDLIHSSPHRSSKRLAGVKVELVIDSEPIERVLRSSAKKSSEVEQNSSNQGKTSLVNNSCSQEETNAAGHILPSETQNVGDPSSKGAEKNRDVDKESEFSFSSAMWTDDDPCLDFAIKTLTGVIPLDDNVAVHDDDWHERHTSAENTDEILLDAGPPPGFSNNNGFSTSQSETNPTHLDFGPPPGFSNNNGLSTSQSKTDPIQLDMGPPPGFSKNDSSTLCAPNKADHVSGSDVGLPPGFSRENQLDHLRGCSLQQSGNTIDHAHLDLGPPPGFSQSNVSCLEMSVPKQLDLNLDAGPPPGFSQGKVLSQTDTMSETKQVKVNPVDFCPRHFTLQEQRNFIDSLFLDAGPPPGFPNKMSSQPDVSGSR